MQQVESLRLPFWARPAVGTTSHLGINQHEDGLAHAGLSGVS